MGPSAMPIDPKSIQWDAPPPGGIQWDDEKPKKAAPEKSLTQKGLAVAGDSLAGLVRGAGSIGATILAPIDAAARAVNDGKPISVGGFDIAGQDRRAGMDAGLGELGADTNSLAFKTGKFGGELAGTAGAGGLLVKGLRVAAPVMTNAPKAVNLLRAIETAGAQGGGLATRSAGGAVSGLVTAGLANPDDALAGMAVGGAAPGVIQLAGKAGSPLGGVLRGKPADPQRLAAAKTASAAGYVIPPSDIRQQGMLTEAMGGLSGKIKTAQVASEKNQGVTTRLAKEALGLPADAPLNREVLLGVRKSAGQAYEVVRGAGTVVPDKAYADALDKIGQQTASASRSFPGMGSSQVDDLLASLRQPQFDASDAVDAIRVLRDKSDGFFAKGDKGEARAFKAASEALESALETHLQNSGNPEALKAFREARQLIAKTYTVEKALNSQTGEVSAQVLAQSLKKGKPLSGGLKTAAEAGEAFPKATQALKESPKAVSPLDWGISALTGTATGNPLALAIPAVRPAVRGALLSGPMQRRALKDPAPINLLSSGQFDPLLYRSAPLLAGDR